MDFTVQAKPVDPFELTLAQRERSSEKLQQIRNEGGSPSGPLTPFPCSPMQVAGAAQGAFEDLSLGQPFSTGLKLAPRSRSAEESKLLPTKTELVFKKVTQLHKQAKEVAKETSVKIKETDGRVQMLKQEIEQLEKEKAILKKWEQEARKVQQDVGAFSNISRQIANHQGQEKKLSYAIEKWEYSEKTYTITFSNEKDLTQFFVDWKYHDQFNFESCREKKTATFTSDHPQILYRELESIFGDPFAAKLEGTCPFSPKLEEVPLKTLIPHVKLPIDEINVQDLMRMSGKSVNDLLAALNDPQ